jgi:hypothetical protein
MTTEAKVLPEQCSASGDHPGEHQHWDIDPAEIVRCLRWHSNVCAEVQGVHPGRYVMRMHFWLGEEAEGDNELSILGHSTVPGATYREAHADLLKATAAHLRQMAQEMEDLASDTMSKPPYDIGPIGVGNMVRDVCVSGGGSPRKPRED